MEIFQKLPCDVQRYILPYTWVSQPKNLLEDIRHYNKSFERIIELYKKSIWVGYCEKGLLFDLGHYIYLDSDGNLGINIWRRHFHFIQKPPLVSENFHWKRGLGLKSKPVKRWVKKIWGLLTVKEREQFILLRGLERGFI